MHMEMYINLHKLIHEIIHICISVLMYRKVCPEPYMYICVSCIYVYTYTH